MSPSLLSIPREVRERIYEHVWAEAKSLRFTYASFPPACGHGARDGPFPEQRVNPYPPPGDERRPAGGGRERTDSGADVVPEKLASEKESLRQPAHVIEFDLEGYLDECSDEEEEEEDDDDDDDDGSSDEDEDDGATGDDAWSSRRERWWEFALVCGLPVSTALLSLTHSLRAEAIAYLFSTRPVVLDADGASCMRLLAQLPPVARRSIQTLTLTSSTLVTRSNHHPHHARSAACWSGTAADGPEYHDPTTGLTCITPFGALLGSRKWLPRLAEVSVYMPCGGADARVPGLALVELAALCRHGRLRALNWAFVGAAAQRTLRDAAPLGGSQAVYDRLMGPWRDCEPLAQHEFALRRGNEVPPMTRYDRGAHQRMWGYVTRRHRCVQANRKAFAWEWGCRDELDLGRDGNVQAVVRCWNEGG